MKNGLQLKDAARAAVEGLRSGGMGNLAAAKLLADSLPEPVVSVPNDNRIKMFLHCALCLAERPEDASPAEWARLAVGWTKEGLQVWCERHDCNVAHVHFEGQRHPANTTRRRKP